MNFHVTKSRSLSLQNLKMKSLIQLIALIIIVHIAYTESKPIVQRTQSKDVIGLAPTEISNADKSEEVEVIRMRILLKEALVKATKRSTRHKRGGRRAFGDRRLKCIRWNSSGKCIRHAMLGLWLG